MAINCPKCQYDNLANSLICGKCGTCLDLHEPSQISVTRTLETSADELSRGTLFAGRYEIIEELGAGGMGRVYRAHDAKLNEEVALKLIKPEIGANKRVIERFRNELKTARKIRHQNVCGMYDFHEEGKTLYITMEYVRGEDLKSLIHRTKTLSVGTALSIAHQVAEGLREAHKLGIVHRDLKPGNIMIDRDGNAKIMDFGIARSLQVKGVTGEGAIIGTPEYMSPEQVDGKAADARSDIYALGVILFEMVTGRAPFEGETPMSIAHKHKYEAAPDPQNLNPQLSGGLKRIILRSLEKDPGKRYRTTEELVTDLAAVEEGFPTTERVTPKRKTITRREITVKITPKKLIIPAAIIFVIAAAALVVWKAIPRKQALLAPRIENSVAVISFENQTGDKSYEYLQKAIPNLLITNLERTGFIKVITWERMEDVLEQIAKRSGGVIDKDAGFEICRREGVGAIILGSFTKAEETFVTDVKVLDAETKKLLRSASSRGEGVSSILKTQIDKLSQEIAQGIGIAQEKIATAQANVEGVTTSSMEAYKCFLEGRDAYEKLNFEEARQNLNKAIEIDPDFALAYLKLGEVYSEMINITASNDAIKKAMTYTDKVSEKERLYIEALAIARGLKKVQDRDKEIGILRQIAEKYPKEKRVYYYMAEYYNNIDNSDKAIEEYKKALEVDPRYATCLASLGWAYVGKGEYENAVEAYKKLIIVRPNKATSYNAVGDGYYFLGKFDEAILNFKKAEEIEPGSYQGYCAVSLSYLYALREEYGEALRWIEEALKNAQFPSAKGYAYTGKAFFLYWLGKFGESFATLDQADKLLKAAENDVAIDENTELKFLFYLLKGELEPARKFNDQWLDIGIDYYSRYYSGNPDYIRHRRLDHAQQLGMIEMKEGRTDAARRWLAKAKPFIDNIKSNLHSTLYNRTFAEVLMAEGQYDQAISIHENSPAISVGPGGNIGGNQAFQNSLGFGFLNDTLARAYQGKGDIDKAIEAYVRLMTLDPKRKDRLIIHPLYHYRVGKLYEQKGQKNKAKIEYEKFLDLWKAADPGLPDVADARQRLAGLTGR